MLKNFTILNVVLGGLLFTLLFDNQSLGLNLIIFEVIMIGWIIFSGQYQFKSYQSKLIVTAQLITCLFTVITYSAFIYIIHFLVTLTFLGILVYPAAQSLLNSFQLSISNLWGSQVLFIKNIIGNLQKENYPARLIWESRIIIIPLIIISIFVSIYNNSNPKFNELTADVTSGLWNLIDLLVANRDLSIFFTFFIGLFVCNLVFMKSASLSIIKQDQNSSDLLAHYKPSILKNLSKTRLKSEFKAAIFLLIPLNCILLVVNIIDINWVWFGFEWEGQYLKQFVHEGTYLLIISILISIAIVLYFYRGAINFVDNKLVRYLSYAWLLQNAVLAISVGIRNYYYIQHFNLAYRRIGVIIFLCLTLYGLFSVYLKVHKKYSPFYLFRTNFNSLLVVLVFSSLINWDAVIANYNFSHSRNSFIHYNFLSQLSDKTLPILYKSKSELKAIDKMQAEKFPSEEYYMTSVRYFEIIQIRKTDFLYKWESKSWLSWNLPEQLAYHHLTK